MRVQRALVVAVAVMSFNTSVFPQVSPQSPPSAKPLTTTIEGQITKIELTSAHVFLYVSVITPNNEKPTIWAIQTAGLSELTAKGIKRSDLRVGVLVRVEGALLTGENRLEVPVTALQFPK